jgi:hypothetical protein
VSVAVLGVVIAIGASADSTVGAGRHDARVCMDGRADMQVLTAPAAVSRIFRDIGVRLEWSHDPRSCVVSQKGIVITFADAPAGLRPGDLAYAMPYERHTVVVFIERVKTRRVRDLLTYVLAHEIAHILQGIARHSEVGILRPRWSDEDYFDMRAGKLAFTDEDVHLIHLGLDVWTLSAAAK